MNILMVNKFFFRKGGAEACFFNTIDLLASKGHQVIPFSMNHTHNDPCAYSGYFVSERDFKKQKMSDKLFASSRMLYSVEAKKKLGRLLDSVNIDVAHLHNIHHHISPSIIAELKSRNIPVALTLHDYKMVCPSYMLLDAQGVCERCSGGSYWRSLFNNCRPSFLERAILAAETYLHQRLLKLYDKVDVFICPSRFLINKLKQMGFNGTLIHVPNFVNTKAFAINQDVVLDGIVYFGRLSREKGLSTLLKAAKELPFTLKVIGDGPQRKELEAIAMAKKLKNIKFMGRMSPDTLYAEVVKSRLVIVPSEWYENNPMSVIESFALEKPVIGSRIGGIPELIQNGERGLTFEPGNADELRTKISWLYERPHKIASMGLNARRFIEEELGAEKHYDRLMFVYKKAASIK